MKQAEAGETVVVTVNGRAVAELGPVRSRRWRRASDVRAVFAGPADDAWASDRELVNHRLADPFTR